jgi:hypothetical protein
MQVSNRNLLLIAVGIAAASLGIYLYRQKKIEQKIKEIDESNTNVQSAIDKLREAQEKYGTQKLENVDYGD